MDALLDKLRVVRAFDISKVMSALVSYIDGVTGGVSKEGCELGDITLGDLLDKVMPWSHVSSPPPPPPAPVLAFIFIVHKVRRSHFSAFVCSSIFIHCFSSSRCRDFRSQYKDAYRPQTIRSHS